MSRDLALYLDDIRDSIRRIAGFRDVIAHGYFGVDLDIVWNVVTTELSDLDRAAATLRAADDAGG